MTDAAQDEEAPIRRALAEGDVQHAAQLTLDRHARDVRSFLRFRLRSDQDRDEVFSMFAEDLWDSMKSFSWRCSMRCWVYILARNAANRFSTAPHRAVRRNLPLSIHAAALSDAGAGRTATLPYQKTTIKERMRALRERLPFDDQQLLVLHVDRGLAFRELASVLHEGATPLTETDADRQAATLRKRFERVKLAIRRMAEADGLLAPQA